MGQFSSQGYIRDRLNVWYENLQSIYISIFGSNIDLSSDTQDGQLVGSIAESLANQDQQVEAASKVVNPAEASGNMLSTLVTLNGIRRIPSTPSTVTLTLSGTNGTTIPAGSLVRETENDATFATDGDAVIVSGTATTTATATVNGPTVATAGTITIIDTQIAGWTGVTNPNAATVGNNEESDAALRVRREESVAIASEGNRDSVSGALKAVDGVVSAIVKENPTNSVDSDGIPAHSIAAIVSGGTNADIAQTIFEKKSSGCNTSGGISETVVDSDGFDNTISFARPIDKDIYIDIDLRKLEGFPADGEDQIKQAIVDYFENDSTTRLAIGSDVIHSDIYIPATTAVEGASIVALKSGVSASPTGTVDIAIAFNEKARFDVSRINITVVP